MLVKQKLQYTSQIRTFFRILFGVTLVEPALYEPPNGNPMEKESFAMKLIQVIALYIGVASAG